jgi:hypothetical protein
MEKIKTITVDGVTYSVETDILIIVANEAALPGTGVVGKLYVTADENLMFRWSGTAYILLNGNDIDGGTF